MGKQVWCELPLRPPVPDHTHTHTQTRRTHTHTETNTRPPGTSCRTKWLAMPARRLPLSPGVRFGGSGCCSSPAGVHTLTLIRVQTHTVSLCPLHTRHPLSHPRQQDSRRTHTHARTHTKEQTDAVTLEIQAKRCRGEKFSLKLENSLFISAFGLQEEFCLFVRFFFVCLCCVFFPSCLCSFSSLSFFVCLSVVSVRLDLVER